MDFHITGEITRLAVRYVCIISVVIYIKIYFNASKLTNFTFLSGNLSLMILSE